MATRTQKAAAKKAKAGAKAPAVGPGPAPKASKAAVHKARGSKSKARARKERPKEALVFEETQSWPEALDTVRAKRPSFFERRRQRRAEKAKARAAEQQRREEERRAAEERRLQAEEEQRVQREAQETEEAARQAAEERKAKAAAKRADAKAAKEEAARREAEEAEAKAAEKAHKAADKAAVQEAARQRRAAARQAKREQMAAEERRLAEEQAAKDAEEEMEARRKTASKRWAAEPDLEFEEASKPVAASHALVPAKGRGAAADVQADRVAAELAKRRSKPVVLVGAEPEAPRIPTAARPNVDVAAESVAVASSEESRPFPPSTGAEPAGGETRFSIPEAFLLLANQGDWDERAEKARPGAHGGALAGALALELLLHRQALMQRDRLVPTGEPTGDAAVAAVVDELRRIRDRKGDAASRRQLEELAKANRNLLMPYKQRLARKGLVDHGSRRHLGLFHRSWVDVTDAAVQDRLQNRLRRAIAGGGTPDASSILLLGLLDAAGLFDLVVPPEAADYNRKRLNGLLGGRDIMGYKVDPELKGLQEIATRTVLANVRVMSTGT